MCCARHIVVPEQVLVFILICLIFNIKISDMRIVLR